MSRMQYWKFRDELKFASRLLEKSSLSGPELGFIAEMK